MRLDATLGGALAEDALTLACLQDVEVSAEVLQELRAVGFPGNLALAPLGESSRHAHQIMGAALAELPHGIGTAAIDDHAADFAAIYLTGAYGASPCESYWLSDDHLVCQDPMFELRNLYAGSGLRVPDWRKRPDDHLVFQLQYLSHCLHSALEADDWRALGRFLDLHLLRWLPQFAARVMARSGTSFYAALAMLTSAWCEDLRNVIAADLGETRPSAEEIEAVLREQRADDAVQSLHFLPGAAGPSW